MKPDDIQKIIDGISVSIEDKISEAVYEQTKSKDAEVSALHREIRDDIKAMRNTVDAHDVVIKEIMSIYRTSDMIKKAITWCILFVPAVAACVAGYIYLRELLKANLLK